MGTSGTLKMLDEMESKMKLLDLQDILSIIKRNCMESTEVYEQIGSMRTEARETLLHVQRLDRSEEILSSIAGINGKIEAVRKLRIDHDVPVIVQAVREVQPTIDVPRLTQAMMDATEAVQNVVHEVSVDRSSSAIQAMANTLQHGTFEIDFSQVLGELQDSKLSILAEVQRVGSIAD